MGFKKSGWKNGFARKRNKTKQNEKKPETPPRLPQKMSEVVGAQGFVLNPVDETDERDMLVDILDSLEHEPSEEVALVAARLASRYLENIDDLSETETASLLAAASADTRGFAWTCARAHEGMRSLWLRVRERDPDSARAESQSHRVTTI